MLLKQDRIVQNENNLQLRLFFFYRCDNNDCRRTREALHQKIGEYSTNIFLREVDIETEKRLSDQFDVFGVPTLLVFNGSRMIGRFSGVLEYKDIDRIVQLVSKKIKN